MSDFRGAGGQRALRRTLLKACLHKTVFSLRLEIGSVASTGVILVLDSATNEFVNSTDRMHGGKIAPIKL